MLECWKAHTKNPAAVRARIENHLDTVALMQEPHLIELSALASHINGEHLGDWNGGADYYHRLHSRFPSLTAATRHRLDRQAAVLDKAQDPDHPLTAFLPNDRFYITAIALPAAVLQIGAGAGRSLLAQALDMLEATNAGDAYRRLLAIVTANLSCDLFERYELPAAMKELMVSIAETGKTLWCEIGDDRDRDRAEYCLSLSRLRAHEPVGNGSGRYPRYQFIEP